MESTGEQGTPHPPPMEWQKCLCPRPKFAPYFLTNHFRFNSILKKRGVGLRKCRKNTFCSQENVEKRGIWGEKWRGRLCLGADVRNGRPLEMGRFEGNGGGGWRRDCTPWGGAEVGLWGFLRALWGSFNYGDFATIRTALLRGCAIKFPGKFFGGKKLRAPHFPTQGSLVQVWQINPGSLLFLQITFGDFHFIENVRTRRGASTLLVFNCDKDACRKSGVPGIRAIPALSYGFSGPLRFRSLVGCGGVTRPHPDDILITQHLCASQRMNSSTSAPSGNSFKIVANCFLSVSIQ